jgi:hypothetical protein
LLYASAEREFCVQFFRRFLTIRQEVCFCPVQRHWWAAAKTIEEEESQNHTGDLSEGGVQMPDLWKARLSLFKGFLSSRSSFVNPSTLNPAKEGEGMDSKRKWYNLGSGILALFIVGLLLGSVTTAWAESTPTIRGEGAKDISLSFVTTNSAYIAPGSSGTWTFVFWNKSGDGEMLDEVTLDFPAGITVTNSSICSIQPDTTTRYLQTDGTTGDGVVVSG